MRAIAMKASSESIWCQKRSEECWWSALERGARVDGEIAVSVCVCAHLAGNGWDDSGTLTSKS